MKSHIILCVLTIMVIKVFSTPTILTYFAEHEVEQDSDYIEISITVHSEDPVLKKAVETAHNVVKKLQNIVLDHCNTMAKKKSECEDVFQASKNKIQPKYQKVRKVDTFMAFIVNHEVTIKVRKFDGLGKMTDKLLLTGNGFITIDSFEWKSEDQQNPEKQALAEGINDGREICQRMGLKLSKILSATEVEEKEEAEQKNNDEGEEGAQQQEEQEEPAEMIIFKFQVECS